jgi:insertion element IS1 protein InsB
MDIKEASFDYLCRNCGRPGKVALPTTNRGYSDKFKRECLKIYVNGMVCEQLSVVIACSSYNHYYLALKAVEKLLPDAYTREQIPDVGFRR